MATSLKRNFDGLEAENKGYLNPTSTTKRHKPSEEANIKVFIRFRPVPDENTSDTYLINDFENSIMINRSEDIISKNGGVKKFFFTEVFDSDSSQLELMNVTCVPLIDDLINNDKSSLIFSYGVTNAGKTHTIVGTNTDQGLLPRSMKMLLNAKKSILENTQNPNKPIFVDDYLELQLYKLTELHNHPEYILDDIELYLESYEIYKEDIYDLLSDPKKEKNFIRTKLQIKEKDNKKVYIKGLLSFKFDTEEEIKGLIEKCLENRSLADTTLNSNSSRAHTIFRLICKKIYKSSANKCINESSLCIVDLAGSERSKRTENDANQLAEACNINKSLLVLGRCLKAFREGQTSNSNLLIPYRDTKLTRILYEYFHEKNNLRMIANINPSLMDFEESMRVLNYAALAKDIQPIKSKVESSRKLFIPSEIIRDNDIDEFDEATSYQNFIRNLFQSEEYDDFRIVKEKSVKASKDKNASKVLMEKDTKIKYLESIISQMKEKMLVSEYTNKLNNINSNFAKSIDSYLKSQPYETNKNDGQTFTVDDWSQNEYETKWAPFISKTNEKVDEFEKKNPNIFSHLLNFIPNKSCESSQNTQVEKLADKLEHDLQELVLKSKKKDNEIELKKDSDPIIIGNPEADCEQNVNENDINEANMPVKGRKGRKGPKKIAIPKKKNNKKEEIESAENNEEQSVMESIIQTNDNPIEDKIQNNILAQGETQEVPVAKRTRAKK